jgi:hypothetical protein
MYRIAVLAERLVIQSARINAGCKPFFKRQKFDR